MALVDLKKFCFKYLPRQEGESLDTKIAVRIYCVICKLEFDNVGILTETEDKHLISPQHSFAVHQIAFQAQLQSSVNTQTNEVVNVNSQIQSKHGELSLFQYDIAQGVFRKGQKKLEKYFEDIINNVFKNSSKKLKKGTQSVYASVIKKFLFFTYFSETDQYKKQLVDKFRTQENQDPKSILKYYLNELKQNRIEGRDNKNQNLINTMIDGQCQQQQSQEEKQEEQFFQQFICDLQKIGQDKLGLALTIMKELQISREIVCLLQFSDIISNELKQVKDQDNNVIIINKDIPINVIKLAENVLKKYKNNSYIFHYQERAAQDILSESKQQILQRLSTTTSANQYQNFVMNFAYCTLNHFDERKNQKQRTRQNGQKKQIQFDCSLNNAQKFQQDNLEKHIKDNDDKQISKIMQAIQSNNIQELIQNRDKCCDMKETELSNNEQRTQQLDISIPQSTQKLFHQTGEFKKDQDISTTSLQTNEFQSTAEPSNTQKAENLEQSECINKNH